MDFLQIALVLLILLLGVMLSILGLQVFLILKDLKMSLDKIDLILGNTREITADIQKPVHVAAELTEAVESSVKTGVEAVKKITQNKSSKRLFKRR